MMTVTMMLNWRLQKTVMKKMPRSQTKGQTGGRLVHKDRIVKVNQTDQTQNTTQRTIERNVASGQVIEEATVTAGREVGQEKSHEDQKRAEVGQDIQQREVGQDIQQREAGQDIQQREAGQDIQDISDRRKGVSVAE